MTKYLIGALLFLAIALAISMKSCNDIRQDRNRLGDNQTALMQKAKFYRTKDSLSVASTQVITLKKPELVMTRPELIKTMDSMGIKPKRVQSASTTSTVTKQAIKTIVRDSLIFIKGRIDTLRCIDYSDKWLTLQGCEQNGKFQGIIQSRDTLIQIVHRIPRRFLFFKYGTKSLRQEITTRNPHATISYSEFIQIIK